jgi:hypothetical protein
MVEGVGPIPLLPASVFLFTNRNVSLCYIVQLHMSLLTIKKIYLSLHGSVRYFCPVLTKLKFSRQVLIKAPPKFQENPSNGNRADMC